MKILFMGTPDFAVLCLEQMIADGHEIVGVVSQPDKPKGRGHKLMPPPVKTCAAEHGIAVYQPLSLKDQALLPLLKEKNPDLIVVVAYGKLLPGYILDFPRYGCVNVHASLLPKYRGAAPIQRSVICGEAETGVTTMYMERGLDTGDMILKASTRILPTETYGELHDRLAEMGAKLLHQTVAQIEDGTAPREKQDDAASNYAPMITKETGHIDWRAKAQTILNLIRGTNPWPMSYTRYGDEIIKVIRAKDGGAASGKPGEVLSADKRGIRVACGDGESIFILELQKKGGKRMDAASFLNGHKIATGTILDKE
mgnify:FL=1